MRLTNKENDSLFFAYFLFSAHFFLALKEQFLALFAVPKPSAPRLFSSFFRIQHVVRSAFYQNDLLAFHF